jgi:hypothetical protein
MAGQRDDCGHFAAFAFHENILGVWFMRLPW